MAFTVFLLVVHAFWADWLWRKDLVDLRERIGRFQIQSRLALFGGLVLVNGVSLVIFLPGVPTGVATANAVYHLLLAYDEARRIFSKPRANAPRGVFFVNHLVWAGLSWMWTIGPVS